MPTYEIQTKIHGHWASDTVGENAPRSMDECREDVAALRALGGEWAEILAPELEGAAWRIREAS